MAPRPLNLIAELTYRCPLRCPYCSNPVNYSETSDALDAGAWGRVMREASGMGVVHVGLTGGEPTTRTDLEEIVAAAAEAQLFTLLVTSGMPVDPERLRGLVAAGLRSVQLSIQDALPAESDRVAGTASFDRKIAIARATRELGLPLILNVVLHRHNLGRVREIIALSRDLDAERLELANTQYHGWALENRGALLPTREQLDTAAKLVREERRKPGPEILYVLPDYFSDRPKPCMGGWGKKNIVVAPDGTVLPCQAASSLPGLEFWRVTERELAACWSEAPGMNAYRGESWMPEPCRSCEHRTTDFGGCRCQAFHLTGDAGATDPACGLAPHHARVVAARAEGDLGQAFRYRGPTRN
ncbi:MAG: pyrroloquinoline quinone biosynthesis protein PqqE [Myxococcota bacterium]